VSVLTTILLTLAYVAAVWSLTTGAFFTRESFPVPFAGFIAATIALIIQAIHGTLVVTIIAIVALVMCGFIALITWLGGER